MNLDELIEVIKRELQCVKRNCADDPSERFRQCSKCDLVMYQETLETAYIEVLRILASLKAAKSIN